MKFCVRIIDKMSLKEMLTMDVKDFAYKIKRFFPRYISKPTDGGDGYVKKLVQIYGRQSSLNEGVFMTSSEVERIRNAYIEESKDYRFI